MFHQIGFSDLEFERIPAVFHSTRGVPQFRSLQVGMPRIPQNVINGVFYLYWSPKDALAGQNPGGTGFIVLYDGTFTDEVPGHHYYAVTNHHVACRGCSTIRLNTKDGGTDVIELDPAEWHFKPGSYDIAVAPLSLDGKIHDISSVSTRQFAPAPGQFSYGIGVGEDVFMIGLFIDHAGFSTNVPSARFGNISMLPNPKAKIEQSNGFKGESYVVDMHSRTGFSGSPVYVYRTFGSDLSDPRGIRFDELHIDQFKSTRPDSKVHIGGRLSGHIRARQMFQLLGIHWGQFPEKWELQNRSSVAEARKDLILEGGYVEGMSGMTCVAPAWHILEVLDLPELKKLRHPGVRAEEQKREMMAKHRAMIPKDEIAAPAPSASAPVDPLANDENPTHREDFTRLVGAVARKPPQED
jgi:hypothetical protein